MKLTAQSLGTARKNAGNVDFNIGGAIMDVCLNKEYIEKGIH